jgi:hypothetical protein
MLAQYAAAKRGALQPALSAVLRLFRHGACGAAFYQRTVAFCQFAVLWWRFAGARLRAGVRFARWQRWFAYGASQAAFGVRRSAAKESVALAR